MKLTRLRLHGFKSFVDPTDFHIEPGLTGVVGPNGCGKSNLVEALRWVMGETSHKSLRAADMESVIFAGSGNRPSRNHAEVMMTIDNVERTAPSAVNGDDVLDISRRIEREAGSTYRINGREVRARDVQIMFADAATGARSPALVHQGRIGEIIQAKPEQRRRVLEDAAGVAGLHARRHEAELRLKAAEVNLTRVEDVVGQLAGQIDGLKRQARQAIRYREVAAKSARPRRCYSTCAGSPRTPMSRKPAPSTIWRCASLPSAPASKPRPRACRRCAPPTCRRCARAKPAPPPACSASPMRARRWTARRPAPASAWASSTAGCRNSPPISSASSGCRRMPTSPCSGSTPKTSN